MNNSGNKLKHNDLELNTIKRRETEREEKPDNKNLEKKPDNKNLEKKPENKNLEKKQKSPKNKVFGMYSSFDDISKTLSKNLEKKPENKNLEKKQENKNLEKKQKRPKKKVFVITGPAMSGVTATKVIGGGPTDYTGFAYDVWKIIANNLKDKYDFELKFSRPDELNTDEHARKTANGTYDLVIGLFFHTEHRMQIIDYTLPVAIDGNAILHLRQNTYTDRMISVFTHHKTLFLYLCVLGLLIGVVLYVSDKKRAHSAPGLKNKNSLSMFLRTVLTGFAAMFGEMGFLAENASISLTNVVIVIILMGMAFIFIMFIQAEITASMVDIISNETHARYSKEEIRGKKFLTCYAVPGSYTAKFERYGAILEQFKGTEDDMIAKYKKDTKTYQGCIITYLDGYKYAEHDPTLVLTGSKEYGYEPACFIIGKDDFELKHDVNNEIIRLKHSLKLHTICRQYYADVMSQLPVCELT